MYMNTQSPKTLALELDAAKASARGWFNDFEDSRLLTGDFDKKAVERLAAEAPSDFLAGWVVSFLPAMLMQQR